jgi:hypothetical protein
MKKAILLTGVLAMLAAVTAAQGLVPLNPPPIPVDPTPKVVKMAGPAPSRAGDSPDAGALRGVQALSLKQGEARLRLADGERTLRPGDAIGADVVKSIEPGQMVLVRAGATPAAEATATVVVKFDELGRGRVRVYHLKDPSPVVAPEVK